MGTTATYQQPTLLDLGTVVDETLGVENLPGEINNTKDMADDM